MSGKLIEKEFHLLQTEVKRGKDNNSFKMLFHSKLQKSLNLRNT
jgi:hypothetical protein